ncbi:MAG: type II toxin-antitoxin system MqsR family toxin [Lachnospiraceae bacterium]|nr:type II toxin-antitoxin system MqsR family toxin [Lachnospiraceae bacterium]
MMDRGNNADISAFLERAKKLISGGRYDFIPRRKNMQDLALHGLTIADAKNEILELTVADYYKGPKQDFDRQGEIWEFKKNIDDTCFYVKVKIDRRNGEDILKCLSFHEDDFS